MMEEQGDSDGRTKPERASFAMVIFHNIPETYPADAHIECKYTLTPELTPSGRDWVGLFKVGWMSTSDYHYYEWAPTPKDYEIGKEADASILFPAHKMPKDDGEFYQFCYVTSAGHVRGASTPFQFKKPCADDYVEIEDPETDMLMIRSKGIVMEEKLNLLEKEKAILTQKQEDLERERDGLVEKLCSMDKNLQKMEEENKDLEERVQAGEHYISQLNQEAHDMNVVREVLQTKTDAQSQEVDEIKGRMERLNEEIKELKTNIRKLQNDKDRLEGEKKNLRTEIECMKETLQGHERTEEHLREFDHSMEQLRVSLAEKTSLVEHLRGQVDCLTNKLQEHQKKIEAQSSQSAEDTNTIVRMSEQLKNTEDKLEAAEKTKIMMQDEMKSYELLKQEMSRSLERSEEECHMLKHQLTQVEETLTNETQLMKSELSTVQLQLQEALKEKEKNAFEKSVLSERLEKTSETSESSMSSLHCLQMAQKSLKERYSKMEQNHQELHSETAKRAREYKRNIKELVRENEDLKERLNMGSNEYRTLYIENKKLLKKLEKRKDRKMSESSLSSQTYLVEVPQQRSSPSETEVETEPGVRDKLEQEIEVMGEELQKRLEKKVRYKTMYLEERDKVETLRKHYNEEAQKKDTEISRLRRKIEEGNAENDIKIRSLQKFVSEKEEMIASLQRKLRDSRIHEDEPASRGKTDSNYRYPCFVYPLQGNMKAMCFPPPAPLVYPPHPGQFFPPPQAPLQTPPLQTPPLQGNGVVSPPTAPVEPLKYPDTQPPVAPRDPTPPLQPLPPPLEPERLSTAKEAAVRSTFSEFMRTEPSVPSAPSAALIDSKEERFEDAIGEAMKICPVCSDSFSADIDAQNFENHVLSHIGHICPICQKLIEDVSDDGFQYHVNQHLDEQKQTEQEVV